MRILVGAILLGVALVTLRHHTTSDGRNGTCDALLVQQGAEFNTAFGAHVSERARTVGLQEQIVSHPAREGRSDPDDILAAVRGDFAAALNSVPEGQHDIRTQLLARWVVSDVQAVVDWAKALPVSRMKDETVFTVATEAAGIQPALAFQLAAELPQSSARDELLAHAIGEWATTDPQAAAKAALAIEEPSAREQALVQLTCTSARKTPKGQQPRH